MTETYGKDIEDDAPDYGDGAVQEPFFELSRLMVVAIDSDQNDSLVWKEQDAPNGAWGADWHTIEEGPFSLLSTGSTKDGRVAMVVQTKTDKPAVHFIDETKHDPDGTPNWHRPIDLKMPSGVTEFTQLAMARGVNGKIEVFGLGTDHKIYWIYQNPDRVVEKSEEVVPPGQNDPITVTVFVAEPPKKHWSDWHVLNGDGIRTINAVDNADGRIALVVTAAESDAPLKIMVSQQTRERPLIPEKWSDWVTLDNAASGETSLEPITALDKNGAINVFKIDETTKQVFQIAQSPPGSETWGPWQTPTMLDTEVGIVTSGLDGNGCLVLAAVDNSNAVRVNRQLFDGNQTWGGWSKVAILSGTGNCQLNYNADGRLTFFLNEAGRGLICFNQIALDSTNWALEQIQLAGPNIKTYGVVRDLTPPEHGG